jgi:hypothetical protein
MIIIPGQSGTYRHFAEARHGPSRGFGSEMAAEDGQADRASLTTPSHACADGRTVLRGWLPGPDLLLIRQNLRIWASGPGSSVQGRSSRQDSRFGAAPMMRWVGPEAMSRAGFWGAGVRVVGLEVVADGGGDGLEAGFAAADYQVVPAGGAFGGARVGGGGAGGERAGGAGLGGRRGFGVASGQMKGVGVLTGGSRPGPGQDRARARRVPGGAGGARGAVPAGAARRGRRRSARRCGG